MSTAKRVAALLLIGMLTTTAVAQQNELTSTEATERLTEWDQAYARLKRDIWNLQRSTAMFGRDFRGRTLSDDLRDFALTKPIEKRFNEQRALTDTQLAKGDLRLATTTLLGLYRDLRDELEGLKRIGEHRMRHRQVAQQRDLLEQLVVTVPNYQPPEPIRTLVQQAVAQLNAGRFEETSRTTYAKLLEEYARERQRLFLSNSARINATSSKPIAYERRSPCNATANGTTGKTIPALVGISQPEYPATSKRAGEEGTLYLQLLTGSSGCVLRYAISFSSGWPALDDAALEWIETLAFVPAAKDGKAVDAWVTLPVVFRLDD